MVVFACSACGESLKKNQVESHYQRQCRNCNMLSCLDCGKDFWGNEYEQHTKCITEEEKYSGKNFVPKPGSNKNENKQLQWLQQVQQAVDKCKTNPRLRGVLNRLKDQPNVPRKKNKFLNFLSNGFNVRDAKMAEQVWDVLMESNQSNNNSSNNNKTESQSTNEKQTNGDSEEKELVNGHSAEEVNSEGSKKLSKRERKEERQKKSHKTEKKDKNKTNEAVDSQTENEVSEEKTKKKSKRKGGEEKEKRPKKRKRDESEDEMEENGDEENENGNQSITDEEVEEPVKKKFKTKFNWNEIIVEILQTKGPEMKIKKLKKKVLAEYLSQGCTEKSEEKLWSRFDKKLNKIPEVKVIGEKVKLKNSSQ